MDWIDFFNSFTAAQGALAGVVMGAFLTGTYNLASKRLEYRNAALARIVEKRMKVYQELEEALEPFNRITLIPGVEDAYVYDFMLDERMTDVFRKAKGFTFKRRWLRPKTLDAYIAFVASLDDIEGFISYASPEESTELAFRSTESINLFFHHLMDCIQADYPFLHVVEESWPSFLKRVARKALPSWLRPTQKPVSGLPKPRIRPQAVVGTEIARLDDEKNPESHQSLPDSERPSDP